jgi:uncharacterized protein (DUF58 family)
MLLVDMSRSLLFGSVSRFKVDLAAELGAVLALSATRSNDKVGLILFSDTVEKYVPPKKGTRHVLRIIRELLYHEPSGTGTDIGEALAFLNRVTSWSCRTWASSRWRIRSPVRARLSIRAVRRCGGGSRSSRLRCGVCGRRSSDARRRTRWRSARMSRTSSRW